MTDRIRRRWLSILIAVLIIVAGCGRMVMSPVASVGSGFAAQALRHESFILFAGGALMAVGVVMVAVGRFQVGGALFIGGGAMVAYFHNLNVAPWLNVAVGVIVMGMLCAALAWRLWLAVRVQRELVTAIDKNPAIKAAIGDGCPNRQDFVRREIGGTKMYLRRKGVLPDPAERSNVRQPL